MTASMTSTADKTTARSGAKSPLIASTPWFPSILLNRCLAHRKGVCMKKNSDTDLVIFHSYLKPTWINTQK